MENVEQSKPGIGSNTAIAGSPLDAPVPVAAGQGRRPVDPKSKRALPTQFGIRLTPDLRGKLAVAAEAAGLADSTWVRRLIADNLADAAPTDRNSGPRCVTTVPPEDLAAAARMLGTLTTFLLRAREQSDGE